MNPPYSMLIQWSNPDQAFLVLFPELTGDRPQTHGDTYEDAARMGNEALGALIDTFRKKHIPLPDPSLCPFSDEPQWSQSASASA